MINNAKINKLFDEFGKIASRANIQMPKKVVKTEELLGTIKRQEAVKGNHCSRPDGT